MAPPVSNNWGFINNPKFDELVTKARQTFDPAARDAALAEAGLDFKVTPRATLGVSYIGQLATDVQDHAVKGKFAWKF